MPSNFLSFNDLGAVSSTGVITEVRASSAGGPLANRVVTFALPFAAGEAPDNVSVSIAGREIPTQVDIKRRHADRSIRHAVISVGIPGNLQSTTAQLTISRAATGTPAASPAVDVSLSSGFDVTLEVTEGNVVYRASAAEMLRQPTPAQWLRGSLVNEYRVSGPLKSGANAHPALEAWFDVRFLAPDAARVSVTLENTLANDARGERYASVRILDSDGRVLFALPQGYVPANSRLRKVFDWGGSNQTLIHTAPSITYLARTGAIPTYDVSKTLHPSALSEVLGGSSVPSWAPYSSGPITSYMPTTGGRSDIGVLPRWTVVALYTGDARAYQFMNAAGEYAGSFPIHLRHPVTRKPYSIDRNPTASTGWWGNQYSTPQDSIPDCGSKCPVADSLAADDTRRNPAVAQRIHQADTAHQPSLAYVPYLLSGDPFFLDELHFWVAHNFLVMNPRLRENEKGLFKNEQIRGQAWSMRTLVQAAWITPDDQREEVEYLEGKLLGNISHYVQNIAPKDPWASTFTAEPSGTSYPEMAPDVYAVFAPWQTDFFGVVMGYAEGMGYTQAKPMREWLNQGLIARLTSPNDYNPYDATPYRLPVSYVPPGCGLLSAPPSTAGCPAELPGYSSVGQLYNALTARRTTQAPRSFGDGNCALCYSAVARAALAVSARQQFGAARAAYNLLNTDLQSQARSMDVDPYLRDPTWLIVP